jgi:hypothetical protein
MIPIRPGLPGFPGVPGLQQRILAPGQPPDLVAQSIERERVTVQTSLAADNAKKAAERARVQSLARASAEETENRKRLEAERVKTEALKRQREQEAETLAKEKTVKAEIDYAKNLQQREAMPIPIIGAVMGAVGIAKKVGPIVKTVGSFIGGLFKSKKKKAAEAAAKKVAAEKVFAPAPMATATSTGLNNITTSPAVSKPVPVWVWVGGGLAFLVTLFLIFKRKR